MLINNNLKLMVRVFIIVSIIILHINTLDVFSFPFRELEIGDPIPDVTLPSLEPGKPSLRFSELLGSPFLVIFWGADLPEKIKHSAKILGGIDELAPFLNERNIQRYSVNVQNDDRAAIDKVISKSASSIQVYLDKSQEAYAKLGIYIMPSVLLVDKDGNVAAGMGYSNDLVDRLKGSVEIMLGEKTAEQVAAELRPEMVELSAEDKASKRHFSFGIVMMKRRYFDQAIREFSQAVEIDPGMIEAQLNLGCLYLTKEDHENAEVALNVVLEAEPESVKGRICRGELLRLRKQLDEAGELLRKVLKEDPENYKAYYYLGRVLEDEQKDKMAMENYKKAYGSILKYSAR